MGTLLHFSSRTISMLYQIPGNMNHHHPPPPTAFGAREAAAAKNNKSTTSSSPRKLKRKTLTPIPDNPFVKKPTSFSVQNPLQSDSAAKLGSQNTEFKNPNPSVDEFVSNLTREPANFDPYSAAWWEDGDKVPFLFLAKAFDLIKGESGRILIISITCNVLRTVIAKTPDDLLEVVYILANKIAPAFQGLELGVRDALLKKVLAEVCGTSQQTVNKLYKQMGDLGDVAKAIRSKQSVMQQPSPLTVTKVFNTFRRIAQESGNKSQGRKNDLIKLLIVDDEDCEPVYLIRLLQAKLRIGLAGQTLLNALGQAAVYSKEHSMPLSDIQSPMEEAGKIVKQVYSVVPVCDKIIPALLSGGVRLLPKACNLTPGVPIGPMLAKPTTRGLDIIEKFQDMIFTCEYKYDGERAQFHYMEDGSVESTAEMLNGARGCSLMLLLHCLGTLWFKKPSVNSFILDCEIVAYDREKKTILPLQVLRSRPRKPVTLSEIKVDVCVFAFDILYLNGKSLLLEQLNVRRKEHSGYFQFVTTLTSNDFEEIHKFLEAALNASCEGLMIRTLEKEATYEPSNRSNNWIKLKKDYMDNFGDSLDLVPIAAFNGKGNRKGVYGSFLLACYDSQNEEFRSICKIGSGFSGEVLKNCYSRLQSKVISAPKPYFRYKNTLKPDAWFEPSEVWEVRASDLTISSDYHAAVGKVTDNKGISLRFPRLIRFRVDKAPEEATSSVQVAEMYRSQVNNQQHKKKDDWEDED